MSERLELVDYLHWFNNFRLHGMLGYLSPSGIQAGLFLIKSVRPGVDNPMVYTLASNRVFIRRIKDD